MARGTEGGKEKDRRDRKEGRSEGGRQGKRYGRQEKRKTHAISASSAEEDGTCENVMGVQDTKDLF